MRARHLAAGALAVLAAAQLVPVRRTNPPVGAEVQAPPLVKAVLRRACWDCHSNETVWGWHTYVAPISWLVAHDVNEGREELNFSTWGALDARRLEKLHRKIPEEVGEGEMPPWLYVLAHPSARLSGAERAAVVSWGRTLGPDRAGADAGTRPDAAAPGLPDGRSDGEEHEGEHGDRRGR